METRQACALGVWRQQMLKSPVCDDREAKPLARKIETRHIRANEPKIVESRLAQFGPGDGNHAWRAIDARDAHAGAREGKRHAAGATCDVEHRSARLARLRKIELDVAVENPARTAALPKIVEIDARAAVLIVLGISHDAAQYTTRGSTIARSRMSVVPLSSASRHSIVLDRAHEAPAPGSGSLQFEKIRGTTVLTRASAASPLRLLHPKNSGSAAWVYAATYGGGLLGGDTITLGMTVGAGASALLSTQASTKVYRAEQRARQRLLARADDGSLLVLLPDPVTPFARSQYEQEQRFELAPRATLVALDWMTAGRVSFGERWRFTAYSSRTLIRRDGRTILHEATRLDPDDGNVEQRLGRFNCVAWAVAIGPAVRVAAIRLAGVLGDSPVAKRADVLLSAAPLEDDGVLLRVAGVSTQHVGAVLKQHLNFIPSLLGDDPWACRP